MTTPETTTSQYAFKAEIKQLLHILVHSLYKDRDIFLRELISNASDALTRIQFELLTNRDVLDPDAELAIRIETPEAKGDAPKQLIIKDSGVGMTRDELIANLGTIAQSGAREFLAKLSAGQLNSDDLIGQFGVGFYCGVHGGRRGARGLAQLSQGCRGCRLGLGWRRAVSHRAGREVRPRHGSPHHAQARRGGIRAGMEAAPGRQEAFGLRALPDHISAASRPTSRRRSGARTHPRCRRRTTRNSTSS